MHNMKKKKRIAVSTKPMSGFMELLPAEQIVFNGMFNTIRQSYETFGFIPLDTPVLERAEVLLAKAGGETEKQIYRFQKGETDLAMRFDLTVPLARYVAEHYGQLTFPFRRYAMDKVYRGERPQAGRFREFYQCDIDIIGDQALDLRYDAEIPSVIYTIFKKLGFEKFTIRVNNRKIFNGVFTGLGISDVATTVMQSIDKLEKVGAEAVKSDLLGIGLSEIVVKQLFEFLSLAGSSDKVILGLKKLGINNDEFLNGVDELSEAVSLMRQFGIPETNFKIDLTIARGLAYYTGTVYETQLDDYPEIGSVCSGGRYDDLASAYTNRDLPGVGISIGLTRLFDQLMKKEVLKIGSATLTKVLILPMTDDFNVSLNLATNLRERGISTEVSFVNGKMKKRLGYANKLGIPWAVFIGEEEIKKGIYALKDLETGKQEEVNQEALFLKIQSTEA